MDVKIAIRQLRLSFGKKEVLKGIDLDIHENRIYGLMGPSASGKSTLISVLNKMVSFEEGVAISGSVLLDGEELINGNIDEVSLRKRIGTVFATPIPLPRSIFENVAFGPRLNQSYSRAALHALVEESLRDAFLWDEVKDRLQESAVKLSGGQQQRLCLARTLALKPEIILLDEPCSGLDPISTAKIEEALAELKDQHTIILVSNNTKQIARATDYVAFFYLGELIEFGPTHRVFTTPSARMTEDYIQGKFG
jgi:phosphate transport system ATP-binding protein